VGDQQQCSAILKKLFYPAYALFLIGITAAFGVYSKWKRREIDLKLAIVFAERTVV